MEQWKGFVEGNWCKEIDVREIEKIIEYLISGFIN